MSMSSPSLPGSPMAKNVDRCKPSLGYSSLQARYWFSLERHHSLQMTEAWQLALSSS